MFYVPDNDVDGYQESWVGYNPAAFGNMNTIK
jgi:hypothetical protein